MERAIVADASAILSVILGEPTANAIRKATSGYFLYSPSCIEYEMCNALSALVKKSSIVSKQAVEAYHEFEKVPLALIAPEFDQSLLLACSEEIYAYDAFYLFCAKKLGVPLLTLDKKLIEVAKECSVEVKPVQGVDYSA